MLDPADSPAFDPRAAVGVVLASAGYPAAPVLGAAIHGVGEADALPGVHVDHAATATGAEGLYATGGRVLTVVGLDDSIDAARARAYQGVGRIRIAGAQHRTDIAAGAA